VLIYGRNLTVQGGDVNPLVREALKCSRTHLIEKKAVRTVESITEDEIQMLEEKYLGIDLPNDANASWEWTGFCY
jgi:hypothetical protein